MWWQWRGTSCLSRAGNEPVVAHEQSGKWLQYWDATCLRSPGLLAVCRAFIAGEALSRQYFLTGSSISKLFSWKSSLSISNGGASWQRKNRGRDSLRTTLTFDIPYTSCSHCSLYLLGTDAFMSARSSCWSPRQSSSVALLSSKVCRVSPTSTRQQTPEKGGKQA